MSALIDLDLLKTFGQIAAPAGLAIGAFLYVARDVIAKNIFPTLTRERGYHMVIAIVSMVWTVALAGIASWTYVATYSSAKEKAVATQASNLPQLPGDTGWIFAGYSNIQHETFIEGPYVSVQGTYRRVKRRFI